jgi:hypothetical protein
MDWAEKFTKGIYNPLFGPCMFIFRGFMFSDTQLKWLEECEKIKITRDYITWKAWITEENK